jgi:hypothetical protein
MSPCEAGVCCPLHRPCNSVFSSTSLLPLHTSFVVSVDRTLSLISRFAACSAVPSASYVFIPSRATVSIYKLVRVFYHCCSHSKQIQLLRRAFFTNLLASAAFIMHLRFAHPHFPLSPRKDDFLGVLTFDDILYNLFPCATLFN